MGQRTELLWAEEVLVVGVVEVFDDTITPRFTLGDKDDFRSDMQTKADQQSKAAGMAIGTPEGEFIIDLEIPGDTQTLPLDPERSAEGIIMLGRDSFKGNGITAGIDEMEAIEANSTGEVPRADQVHLLCHTGCPGFEFRIRRAMTPGKERSTKPVARNDAIDRPGPRKRIDAELAELPLDCDGSTLRVLPPKQSGSDLADETFDPFSDLAGLVEWGT